MMNQLNPRERVIVISGAIILVLILLYLAVISPYRNALARLDSQVEVRSQQLEEVEALIARYKVLQREVRQVERLLDNRRDFSALTFIENLVETTAGRASLVSMRPQPSVTSNQFILESVEVKLEKLELRQVLELLWAVEDSAIPMQVKSIYLRQRFDDRSQLDTTMTITALRRAA